MWHAESQLVQLAKYSGSNFPVKNWKFPAKKAVTIVKDDNRLNDEELEEMYKSHSLFVLQHTNDDNTVSGELHGAFFNNIRRYTSNMFNIQFKDSLEDFKNNFKDFPYFKGSFHHQEKLGIFFTNTSLQTYYIFCCANREKTLGNDNLHYAIPVKFLHDNNYTLISKDEFNRKSLPKPQAKPPEAKPAEPGTKQKQKGKCPPVLQKRCSSPYIRDRPMCKPCIPSCNKYTSKTQCIQQSKNVSLEQQHCTWSQKGEGCIDVPCKNETKEDRKKCKERKYDTYLAFNDEELSGCGKYKWQPECIKESRNAKTEKQHCTWSKQIGKGCIDIPCDNPKSEQCEKRKKDAYKYYTEQDDYKYM